MGKVSKVVKVVESAKKTWTGKDGTLYYSFDYSLEDSTIITASHKSEKHFNIGDEIEYEITRENQYGKAGTVKKPSPFVGANSQKSTFNSNGIKVGHAVNNAVLIQIHLGQVTDEDIKARARRILALSDELELELKKS